MICRDLSFNQLTGTIPSTNGLMTSLRTLYEHSLTVFGKKSFFSFVSTLFYFRVIIGFGDKVILVNFVNCHYYVCFVVLTNYMHRDFGSNKLTGTIPETLSSLTKLSLYGLYFCLSLVIDHCQL